MAERVRAEAVHLSVEHARQMLQHPELLAHLIDNLTQALDHAATQMNGQPGEFIDVLVLAERRVVIPDLDDTTGR